MSTRKRTSAPKEEVKVEDLKVEGTEVTAETEEVAAEETPVEEVKAEETPAEEPKSKEPVEGELHDAAPANTLKSAQSAEDIHAKIRAKLDGRHQDGEETRDLFNPAASVAASKAKMQSVAEEQGFQLTRGREIGARLLARANQNRR